ncbi:tRNA uridine(34) 5-carboxymethylaminomethyl modification radical SAM/GNAT enzyme Elp3 [Patescibacteria group bacterium]|nr:tRNA uridine(34) 5-carboxymethylaminomethyl modification radical SAM/GNAT enzyme Elp3 [Patescibacteria group bacterium]
MQKAIRELLKLNIKTSDDLMMAKRKIAKKYGIGILRNSDILKELNNAGTEHAPLLRNILRKRAVRTMSGIAPVAVLTMPYPCPGKCAYCPTEKNVPQSYLSNEPAVMRAIRCGYDPYLQTQMRLSALEANGHKPEKIELIVIGGTWSVLPDNYKYWFIAQCFKAANDFRSVILRAQPEESQVNQYKIPNMVNTKSAPTNQRSFAALRMTTLIKELTGEQKRNEKAKYKIIGLTLETRPDYINKEELLQMRELGCTRVELGVQAIDDKILKLNKRGHGVDEIARATELLKNYGFKVTYHIMPGLPGATPAKDLKMFKRLFSDERFQPDQIKFYPTVVTRGSLLYKWWKAGKYKPYSDKILRKLIIDCKKYVPEYVRIIRLIRDIPRESIVAGNIITNLRQVIKDAGAECKCIRCREAREHKFKVKSLKLKVIKYKASGGQEYFISFESKNGKILYGFCRLRTQNMPAPLRGARPGEHKTWNKLNFFNNTALIRELHVYGELVPVGENKKIQHSGLGKKLMAEAEKIARENGYKKIAVISGIGARNYYRKLGYRLSESYMMKADATQQRRVRDLD